MKPKRPPKTKTKPVGLPPGSLTYTGESSTQTPQITYFEYNDDTFHEKQCAAPEDLAITNDKSIMQWFHIEGSHDVALIDQIGRCFTIHPLVLEDLVNTSQRPKIEEYDNCLYIVIRLLSFNDTTTDIASEQISLIVGEGYLISLRDKPGPEFDSVFERLRTKRGRIRRMGADYLAYVLMDTIVDHYFRLNEQIEDRLEDLEDSIYREPAPEDLRKIHHLRHLLIHFRRPVRPLREVVNVLVDENFPLISEETEVFWRDLYDHVVRVLEALEINREVLSGYQELYLSFLSNKMNDVMKVLTLIATIFIPLTFIAGVYGMNFQYMPELSWPWSYPLVWLFMIACGLAMLWYFKRRKWL